MQKKSLLALLLAAMLVMSGCSLITVDKEVDNARIIVDVNGETVNKATVQNMIDYQINQNAYTNQMYEAYLGMSANLPTDQASIQPTVIENYVSNLVAQQKIRELGLDQLTEEEQAQVQQKAEADYAAFLEEVALYYLADEGLEGEALTARAAEYAEENSLGTLDTYVQSATAEMTFDKLEAYAVKDVQVTEEELAATLAEYIAADEAEYAANANAYASAVNAGNTAYYAPAGLRYVKQILVMFSEEDAALITEKTTAQTAAQNALTAAQTALDEAAEDADKDALTTALTDAQVALAQAAAELEEAKNTAVANIQEKTDEIYAKAIAEGADFDALVAEYNEDTGAPAAGYVVGSEVTTFVAPFTAGAMALESIGAVSQPVLTDYGYHILQYSADVAEGPVALDAVRDIVHEDALAAKNAEVFAAAMEAWVAEADVKTYPQRMN